MKPLFPTKGLLKTEYILVVMMISILISVLLITTRLQVETVHSETCDANQKSLIFYIQSTLFESEPTDEVGWITEAFEVAKDDYYCPNHGTYTLSIHDGDQYEVQCSVHSKQEHLFTSLLASMIQKALNPTR